MLQNHGLVEDLRADEALVPEPVTNPETLAFFRRSLRSTGWNASAFEAWRRLREHRIVIVGAGASPAVTDLLRTSLVDTGIEDVSIVGRDSLQSLALEKQGEKPPKVVVISMCLAAQDMAWHQELDSACAAAGIPWLRVVADPCRGYADVGPFFISPETCCYRCFHAVHSSESSSKGPAPMLSPDGKGAFWAGMAGLEIIWLISRIDQTTARRGLRRYNLVTWEATELRYPRIPGCPNCRPSVSSVVPAKDVRIDTAIVFEDDLVITSRHQLEPAAHAYSVRTGAALSQQAKSYQVCWQLDLPPSSALAKTHGEFNVDHLTTLLQMTAGFRGLHDRFRRWAATAGNLGSVEIYVLARDIVGLKPGTWFYQPLGGKEGSHDHSLAWIEWHRPSLEISELLRRAVPGALEAQPDAVLVFTGAFERISRKYGPFALKLIHLDAGAAVGQLRLLAEELGLHTQVANSWADDLLEDHFLLNAADEAVTAVVSLSRTSLRKAPLAGCCRPLPKLPSVFGALTLPAIATMLRDELRVIEAELIGVPTEPSFPDELPSEIIPLPTPAPGDRTAGEVFSARHTVRSYSAEPVSLQHLSTVIGLAQPEEISLRIVAKRVTGLDPGVYLYHPSSHALSRDRALPDGTDLAELFVQPEFASAPVHIWATTNLAEACANRGAVAWRDSLVSAGAVAHRQWFAALRLGMDGAIIAGLIAGAARRILGFDGYRISALVAVTIGHESRSSDNKETS
jgi:SagB-type dehydrogenase family enzyme